MNQTKPGQSQPHRPTPPQQGLGKSPVELGGNQAAGDNKPQSIGQHLDGALNFIADSLFGGSTESPAKDDSSSKDSNNLFANALKGEKSKNSELSNELKKQKQLSMHKEMQMREVFDLEKKKSAETIKQIKQELELLIKDMKNVDKSVQTAVFQEETNPGTYHVSFFTQLRNFLVLLRKRMKEGATWAQTWNTKRHKSKFAQNSSKYGSKYMFGQEGQGLTRQSG